MRYLTILCVLMLIGCSASAGDGANRNESPHSVERDVPTVTTVISNSGDVVLECDSIGFPKAASLYVRGSADDTVSVACVVDGVVKVHVFPATSVITREK